MAKHSLDLSHITAGALALALAPAFWPTDAAAHTCDAPFTTELVTGTGIDVGQVKVCNDAEFLTVAYETAWPWCVLRTNLHVARDLAGIPKVRVLGIPNFLRFEFSEEVDCAVPAPVEIPLDGIDGGVEPGETVTIAARAVVEGEGPDGTHPQCLLGDKCVAWGEGPRFRPRLPAMYFTYEVQEALLCGGETSKCVFVTSTIHDGNLGGLGGADAICNARATEAGLPGAGSYLAWLSAGGVSPSTRFTQAAVPYKRVDGTTVAGDWADLVDGSLAAPIQVTEGGIEFGRGELVWTGTAPSGVPEGNECLGWVVANSQPGLIGSAEGLANEEGGWTSFAIGICMFPQHLYCFQQ